MILGLSGPEPVDLVDDRPPYSIAGPSPYRHLYAEALAVRDAFGGSRTRLTVEAGTRRFDDAELAAYVADVLDRRAGASAAGELLVLRWLRRVSIDDRRFGRAWTAEAGRRAYGLQQAVEVEPAPADDERPERRLLVVVDLDAAADADADLVADAVRRALLDRAAWPPIGAVHSAAVFGPRPS